MAFNPKILAFAGSARKDSFNKKLVKIAAQGARGAGAQVTELDFGDLPLPLFDQDLEAVEGLPAGAIRLKELMREHDGFLIASPEYNSSISPMLKNAIDWASRSSGPADSPMSAFKGKAAALMSASPGGLGGLRGLVAVRSILINIGVLVLPDQVAVRGAHDAFADDGSLKDTDRHEAVERLGSELTGLLAKLKAGSD